MTQNDLQNTILIGLAARGALRVNAMKKQAAMQKSAGYDPNNTPNQFGTTAGGLIIDSLFQAAKGKALINQVK